MILRRIGMKKLFLFALALVTLVSFTACKAVDSNSNNETLEASLEEILGQIYETADLDEDFKQYVKPMLETKQIGVDNEEYNLGKAGIEYESGIASESMMRPGNYSLCLVRVKEGADVNKVKKEMKENVNPNKWICSGVDPKNVIVDSLGDVVFLVMSDDYANPLHEAFLALGK